MSETRAHVVIADVRKSVSPAEVPVEMNSFKSQQHRWAKGSIQTTLKLLPRLLSAPVPLRVKAEAFFHLTANFNYLLMIALSVLMFPAMYVRYSMGSSEMLLIDVPFFFAATWSVAYFYMVSQRELYPATWVSRLTYLPFLMSIGIGLAVNNARAVIEALSGKETEFARTPKYGIEAAGDDWSDKKYRQTMAWQPLVEVLLGLYFTGTVFYALSNQIYGSLPFLILFQVGFLYTGLLSLLQALSSVDAQQARLALEELRQLDAALAPGVPVWLGGANARYLAEELASLRIQAVGDVQAMTRVLPHARRGGSA